MYDKPADGEEGVFNPFASEDISPPFSRHWEAKRELAQAVRELTEALVTSNSTPEHLAEITASLREQTESLRAAPRLPWRSSATTHAKVHSGQPGSSLTPASMPSPSAAAGASSRAPRARSRAPRRVSSSPHGWSGTPEAAAVVVTATGCP